jgi:hypothetical protein
MSYMRGVPYVYDDGKSLVIVAGAEVSIPNAQAEELAAMLWFRIPEERRREVLERTYEEHWGNFGCEGVARELGRPTGYDIVRATAEAEGFGEATRIIRETKDGNSG